MLRSYKEQVLLVFPEALCRAKAKMPHNIGNLASMTQYGRYLVLDKMGPAVELVGSGDSPQQAWHNAYVNCGARRAVRRASETEGLRREAGRKRRALRQERLGKIASADLAREVLDHCTTGEHKGTNETRMLALHRIRQLCEGVLKEAV